MKKIYFTIAVLAAAALTSCEQEQSFDEFTVGENEIAFVIQDSETRSAEIDAPEIKGETYNLGQVGDLNLILEETITDLNGIVPETKGTPIYTQNVGDIYADKLVVSIPGFDDATYESMEKGMKYSQLQYNHDKNDATKGKGWRYRHNYSASIWPTGTNADKPVDFYLRMPDDMTTNGVTMGTMTGGTTNFSYTSPITAAAQQDILFSYVSMTETQHKNALPNGYPVKFYHALSGIKFAINNNATEREKLGIEVTGITFIGLKNTGSCSYNAGAFTWSNVSATSATNSMSETFTTDDMAVTYDEDLFPSSFFTNNQAKKGDEINKKDDASYTFWVIPQDFANNNNAKILINYKMNGATESLEIPLKAIATKAWAAGQLRTFTFKLNDVNLKIEDKVNIPTSGSDASNAFKGSWKDEVTITNTGNTDAYIRAAIVGQWRDTESNKQDDIIFGFRDEINNLYIVESWYQDQFGPNAQHKHGEFVGLAGYKDSSNATGANNSGGNPFNGWTLCTDGFYYYTTAVEPGGTTTDLFKSYTLKQAPTPTAESAILPISRIYFTLEIATQAISANDPDKFDGTNCAWDVAWQKADKKNIKPVAKQ